MHMLRDWQVPRCGLSLCVSGAVRLAHAADDELAAQFFVEAFLEIDFDAIEIVRRKKLAVGQLRQTFDAAADAREDFDLVVPRRDLVVGHRPGNAHALFGVGFEIHADRSDSSGAPT